MGASSLHEVNLIAFVTALYEAYMGVPANYPLETVFDYSAKCIQL